MYTMLPFHHMSRTFNDLFDEMERSMFPAQESGRLPAFRTDIKDQATTTCWRPTCPASGRRTSTCTWRTTC